MGITSFGGKNSFLDNPFVRIDEILEETKNENIDAKIVDFHAEATSEKYSMGFYLDGRVDAVLGTHTHVPTCDNMVLPKGTLYITDIGMCGAIDSSLGVKADITIKMFLTAMNQHFEWESAGRKAFRSVLLDLQAKTIVRIDKII
jgi:calcineurin-like phosphoesterase